MPQTSIDAVMVSLLVDASDLDATASRWTRRLLLDEAFWMEPNDGGLIRPLESDLEASSRMESPRSDSNFSSELTVFLSSVFTRLSTLPSSYGTAPCSLLRSSRPSESPCSMDALGIITPEP